MRKLSNSVLLVMALTGIAHAESALEIVVLHSADGRPAAGAAVSLNNPQTGEIVRSTTDANGRHVFSTLATSGTYVAVAETPTGTITSDPIQLRSNFTSSVTLLLGGGADLEELTVTSRRSLTGLNVSNAEVSASLNQQELRQLPVEAGDLSTVLFRLPNVTRATGFFPEAPAVSINGANSLFTQYLVDGLDNNENFLGGQKFATPVSIVRDVTVLANSYSVEFGRTANGIVNVTTRGGTNELEVEPYFLWRPGASLDSSNDLPARDLSGNAVLNGFSRRQGGIVASGPLLRDRSFFFANVETTRDHKDNRLTVPLLGVDETIRGENRFDYYTLRLDHRWNDAWTSTVRFNRGDVEIERQGGGLEGGFTFPSAGDTQTRLSNLVALQTRYAGDRLSYVGDLQFSSFDWNYGEARAAGPQVSLLSPLQETIGVIGNNGFFFDSQERTWQTKHKLNIAFDRWSVNAGLDVLNADFSLAGGGNPFGNYVVLLNDAQFAALRAGNRGVALNVSDVPAGAQVLDYAVELRPARFGTDQSLYGVWTEVSADVTDRLTLRLGVRYDYDDLTRAGDGSADDDNFAPRVAFNYRWSETQALRGGAGIFYEKLPYVIVSDALQRNADTPGFRDQLAQLIALGRLPANTNIDRIVRDGNQAVNLSGVPFLQGPRGAELAAQGDQLTAAERQILNPFGYDNPWSFQASIGYQQLFAQNWMWQANLLYSRGHDLVRLIDVNSPAPYAGITADQARTLAPQQLQALVRSQAAADASRPTQPPAGGARSVLISDTGGRSKYRALNLGVSKDRGTDPYALRLSYTWSRLKNDTDDINFRAQDANNFEAEYARSLNDREHVVSTILYLYPLEGLTVSLAALWQSGQPINYGPDATLFGTTDLNGDGRSFAGAYTGNPDRAPGEGRNSGRLPSSEALDLGLQYMRELGTGRLEARMDVFNVSNHDNLSGYAVNATASNQFQVLGQALSIRSADRPRTFQFGLQYAF